jgi:hypothetical protein
VEVKQHQLKSEIAVLEIFYDAGNISRAGENIRGNTTISAAGILGYYRLKQHKP